MTRRLLVVDRYDADALAAAPPEGTDVLLLGLSNIRFAQLYPERAAGARLVDPAPLATAAADAVADFLIPLVERLAHQPLAGHTMLDLLASARGTRWWFLEITEKGPLRGPLVSQLYLVALAREAQRMGRYDEIDVRVDSPAIAAALRSVREAAAPPAPEALRTTCRYLLNAAATLGRLIAVKSWLAIWDRAPRAAGAPGVAAFSFYPVWWTRAFSANASDRFFSDLESAGVTRYVAWLTSPGALWRNARGAAAAIRARRLDALQRYARIRDAVGLVAPSRLRRIWIFERRMKPAIRERFAGCDVSSLIASELSRSMSSIELSQSTLIELAAAACPDGRRPGGLLYRVEFQPFESALLRGFGRRVRAIGFLHYPYGRHYLSTRFAPGEAARHLAHANPDRDRPLPDGVIACGEVGLEHLEAGGYPRARAEACGPQRFGRLIEYRRQAPSRAEARARLGLPAADPFYLVTLAITAEDTEAMFAALTEWIRSEPRARLLVRPHPNRPHGDPALAAAMAGLGQRAAYMPADAPLYDYLVASDGLICIGSMIAFEAMALDRMPVVFENPSSFPALSLREFEDSLFVVRDVAELSGALADVAAAGSGAAARSAQWPRTLARVLGDLETPLPAQMQNALTRLETRLS